MKLFFFTSTIDNEVNGVITVATRSASRAKRIVSKKFLQWGYKGEPKLAI